LLKPVLDPLLVTLYCGYILPIFDYWDTVWSPSTVALSKSLERVYSQFVGHLSNIDKFVEVTLSECRRFHTAIQVFKSVHGLGPVYLSGSFVSSVALTGHYGRSQEINIGSFCLVFALLLVKAVSIFTVQSFGISCTNSYTKFVIFEF